MKNLVGQIGLLVIGLALLVIVYQLYGQQVINSFSVGEEHTMYVENVAVAVTVAKTEEERKQGLSGVEGLREQAGKLFIFDRPDTYGIWMKDMLFPIDIIWISEDLRVVDIHENVSPDTYPTIFSPREPARFVLEANAFFVDSFAINVGDRVTLPPDEVPLDLR